jgi:ribonuclease BN (tRNA processing enzyme)
LTGDGATLAYSGDTEFFPELEEKVRGADLFLCEATYSEVQLAQGARNHLTAAQAAAVARCAGVGRLLLTHLSPPQDLAVLLREAGREFAAVALAEEGRTYPVGA